MSELPPLLRRITDLSNAMRRAGVGVSVSEDLDAVAAVRELDLLDRESFRSALASLLVKSQTHRRTFDELFDVFFPARPEGEPIAGVEDGEGTLDDREPDDFMGELVDRLMSGDDETIRRMAREAVARYGRAEGRDGGVNYFEYRVLRVVDPNQLLSRLLRERASQLGRDPSPLEERLWRDEFEARLRQLRQEIEAEVRRRYADQHGPQRVADRLVRAPLEERDLFRLTADEQRELHAQIRPLARKLAARVAVKRKHGRDGRLDVRRTVRRSLNTGGVPFEPVMRPRRPHKPELFVLCDVSGSVASFARFTLMLVHALQDQFSKVRSFAFVDTLDEVTALFGAGDLDISVSRMLKESDLIWYDGHSDYGHSLEVFHRRYAVDVTARSTVLLLGDARNNHRRSNAWVLEDLSHRSRRLLWLNPEPRNMWETGDSIAGHYARFCDEMVEVRSLKQLARFVEHVA